MKLFECIGKGGRDVGSRFAVQPLGLDKPGTSGRIPERTSEVAYGLGVVVGALPTSSVTSCDPQPPEPGVVHDHIRLRQHQIVAVACIAIAIGARHMEHAGTTEGGETVGRSSRCGELSGMGARPCTNASREQTKQQKQAAKDATQPMLWVDVRGDDEQGQALVLRIGNSGPSIARNVKMTFDPAPPSTLDIKPILQILKQGLTSLPPSRTMQWALGAPTTPTTGNAHRVRIEAEGPFGTIEPLEYVISVDDLNGSHAAPSGNLHAVAAELHEMTEATKELNEIIRSASLEPA